MTMRTTLDVIDMIVAIHVITVSASNTIPLFTVKRPQCGKQVPLIKMKSQRQVMFCAIVGVDMLSGKWIRKDELTPALLFISTLQLASWCCGT